MLARAHLAQRAAVVALSAAVGLAGMLVSQPEQGSSRGGFSLLLHLGSGRCLHLHHWLVCGVVALLVVFLVTACRGCFTPVVLVLLGLLAGTAASDGVYHDLSLERHCVVCEEPGQEWRVCERTCRGT